MSHARAIPNILRDGICQSVPNLKQCHTMQKNTKKWGFRRYWNLMHEYSLNSYGRIEFTKHATTQKFPQNRRECPQFAVGAKTKRTNSVLLRTSFLQGWLWSFRVDKVSTWRELETSLRKLETELGSVISCTIETNETQHIKQRQPSGDQCQMSPEVPPNTSVGL